MRLRVCSLCLAISAPALGQDTPPPLPPPWSGEAQVGLVSTSGNSETSTANAKFQLIYNSRMWRNTLDATVIKAEQTSKVTGVEEVTAERYLATNKSDFNLTDRDYVFLALEFEKDLAGPVRQRTSETAGYGRKVLTGPNHLLELELGAGMRQTETQIILPAAPEAIKDDDVIGRGRVAYRWNFREGSHFAEAVKAETGDSNTFMESVTELRVDLIGSVYALASYTLRQNTKVPPGSEKTDTITAFSLGWTFNK